MTTKTQETRPAPQPVPEMVPLGACVLSPLNPRQEACEAEIASLAASIRAVGLLQNLAGWRTAETQVEIVAGGRRLRALGLIAEEDGTDPAEVVVPVLMAATEAEARSWAGTENVARLGLHPAEEVAAYRDLAATGLEMPEIARAFAVTVRHVRGRLRLAGLADPILAALKSDAITLDEAAAYTVSADPAQQLAVFEGLQAQSWGRSPREIRSRLMAEATDPTDKLARFIGREAYEAAGGAVREDLFGEDVYFLDRDLLVEMALAKLEAAKADHLAEGWAWIETGLERPGYEETRAFGRTYPGRVAASEDEAARYDVLAEAVEDETASAEEIAEFDALAAKLDAEHYAEAQKAHAGVILWIGYDGEIASETGLIRPEDREAAEAAGVIAPSRHPTPSAAAQSPAHPFSRALAADLAELKTGALQTALLAKPELVLDLLTFVLTHRARGGGLSVGIAAENAANGPDGEDGLVLPKALKPIDPPAPLDATDAATAFAAFRRKRSETRARLLTEAIARTVAIGVSEGGPDPFAAEITRRAGVDLRAVWTPGKSFFKRLKKDQLLAIHQEIMHRPAPSATLAKQSKAAIADWLHLIFSGEKGAPTLTEAQQARVAAWVPEHLVEADAAPEGASEAARAA